MLRAFALEEAGSRLHEALSLPFRPQNIGSFRSKPQMYTVDKSIFSLDRNASANDIPGVTDQVGSMTILEFTRWAHINTTLIETCQPASGIIVSY